MNLDFRMRLTGFQEGSLGCNEKAEIKFLPHFKSKSKAKLPRPKIQLFFYLICYLTEKSVDAYHNQEAFSQIGPTRNQLETVLTFN